MSPRNVTSARSPSSPRRNRSRLDAAARCIAERLEGRTLLAAYPGPNPAAIPGTIEAENYDTGGEGVAYHDTTVANQGGAYRNSERVDVEAVSGAPGVYALDYTAAGEWLKYTVKVGTAGSYNISFRVASGSTPGGKFHLEVDGTNVTGAMTVPQSSAWNVYNTITKSSVNLTAGQHTLRLVMDSVGGSGYVGNFNWIQFAASTPATPGTLDSSFGVGGNATIVSAGSSDLAIQNDGKLLLVGGTKLTRISSTGAPDTTFGSGGSANVPFSARRLTIQPDGKILVVGTRSGNFAVARYNLNGTLDTSFGGTGAVSTDFGGQDQGLSVVVQHNGAIVVGGVVTPTGNIFPGTNDDYAAVRYNANGTLDATFGTLGKARTDLPTFGGFYGMVLQPNGKFVGAGEASVEAFGVVGMSASGAFGGDASAFGSAEWGQAGAIAIAPDGKLVAAGGATYYDDVLGHDVSKAGVARFSSALAKDTTFNSTGERSFSNGGFGAVAVQSNGKIVAGGDKLVRLTSAGANDSTFGSGGVVSNTVNAIAIQRDGKIVTVKASGSNAIVSRYIGDAVSPTPSLYTPFASGAVIQAEDFDNGGEGVGYHDADAGNNGGAYRYSAVDVQTITGLRAGYCVGWTSDGEWLNYTVNCATTKAYSLDVRLASPAAGSKFHLEVDGVNKTGSITVPATGGWQTFSTKTVSAGEITAGQHRVRLVMDSAVNTGGVTNIDWFRLV